MEKATLYQAVEFAIVIFTAEFLERRRPGHSVDRGRDLPLNLLALSVVIFAGEAWKSVLLKGVGLSGLTGYAQAWPLASLPWLVKIVLGTILADFALYWVHRLMHANRLAWRTHVFHHTIEHLWWLSGSRTSVTHLFLFAAPQVFIVYVLFQLSQVESGIAFGIGIVVNVWIHTNITVDIGPLKWLFITPDYHRVHHGARGLSRKNLAFVLTVWDRMFGTYADPEKVGEFQLGFAPLRSNLVRMIIGV